MFGDSASRFGVREIRMTEKQVWALTDGGIGGRTRGGVPLWKIDSDINSSLRSFTSNPTNSHEILAGGIGDLLLVNTSRGDVVKRFDTMHPIQQLHSTSRSIVSASPSGLVQTLDARTGRSTGLLSSSNYGTTASSGGLSGMDVLGDHTVITWGWDMNQGQPMPDQQIKVYDLRMNKPLPSVFVEGGAAYARLHPTESGKLVVSSAQGQVQVLNMNQQESSSGSIESTVQLELASYVTSMAISPQGDYLAVGDAEGQVHLLTSHDISETTTLVNDQGMLDLPPMNGYEGRAVEWPDVPTEPLPVDWTDRTPLNVIGVPHYNKTLLSNFGPAEYATDSSPLFNPPPEIPALVLNNMRVTGGIGYAALPKELRGRRNVVCRDARSNVVLDANGVKGIPKSRHAGVDGHRRESGPKFRSEKDRLKMDNEEALTSSEDLLDHSAPGAAMPRYYRKVEIKYSRFGVEDFDFGFYNKTKYSGLETHIANSYTNSVLQALHYTEPIRACAKAHISVDCPKEHCLLCEAGFLSRMLEDAQGVNCQASNFSRAFSFAPQAGMLGLFVSEDDQVKPDQSSLIQKFNRWLLTSFGVEDSLDVPPCVLERTLESLSLTDDSAHRLPPISQVMALTGETINTCSSCSSSSVKKSVAHVIDLLYPRSSASFSAILRASLIRDSTVKVMCPSCKRSTIMQSRRLLERRGGRLAPVPPVLCLNASILSEEHRQCWNSRSGERFLPNYIRIRPAEGKSIEVSESSVPFEDIQTGDAVYTVRALVCQIQTDVGSDGHLVAFAKVPGDDWVLFNDFLVRKVPTKEALSFDTPWKTPSIVILERIDSQDILSLQSLPNSVDPSILFQDVSMSYRRRQANIKHKPLKPAELPKKGTLIAIDAEFVALQLEELEIRSDGSRKVLRPTKMSLARVSVLRGSGDKEGKPFIDDYIHTSEKVVNYLTEYSGIKEGDLDPNTSPHTVVPLKVAYKKLRLLVDLGCIFIGHGLPKDFRTINIFVPAAQVVDTVSIYFDPHRHRKLSLRFLVWFLLKQEIQLAEHDSIEDARCALLLYKKYLSFVEENRFEDVLNDIYESGRRLVSLTESCYCLL